MRHTVYDTAIGPLTFVADDASGGDAIVGIYFPGHWVKPMQDDFGPAVHAASDPLLSEATAEMDEYLAGDRTDFTVPIATKGDPLSERVWALLRRIPYGRTTTYGSLARELGNPNMAQAVGRAVGHNPISIMVPCHRVIGSDGSLTGFAGGLERKRFLLSLEEPAEVKAERLF